MQRIMMVVAYDGTDYCGWQVQPNGVTIEEKLNDALSELLEEPIHVIGASRTDSGVHSLGSVCVFDTESDFPADKICFAINHRLPEDIVVQRSQKVADDWHPRYAKSRKTYEYRILNRTFQDPTMRRNTYFFHRYLNVEKMQQAAEALVGEHDFESFASIHRTVDSTVRTLYECSVNRDPENPDLIRIRVCGNGFLYNMVRIIAGTLIQVGSGEIASLDISVEKPVDKSNSEDLQWGKDLKNRCNELPLPKEVMQNILEARNREAAGPTAPAHGLTMLKTEFERR